MKKCVEDSYLAGIDFIDEATEKHPTLTQQDLTNIDQIFLDMHTQFWQSVENIRNEKLKNSNTKIAGAASPIDAAINLAIDRISISLATSAVNSAVVSANEQVQEGEPIFRFATVGDDRVCTICDPLDGQLMKISDNSLRIPPLHHGCRCRLDLP